MEIKLMPVGRPEEAFTFPSLPQEVGGSQEAHYQTYTVISRGNVMVPKGLEANEFTWEGEFYGAQHANSPYVTAGAWQEPLVCVDTLRKWMDEDTVLNLIVTDTWINQDVTISSFSPSAYGGHGNIRYSITLSVYENLMAYTTQDLHVLDGLLDKLHIGGRTPRLDLSGTNYEIKEGDTLWVIAIRVYGDGSLWNGIWKKNKKVLNRAAKAAGYKNADKGARLIPGTVIKLP